MSGLEKSGLGEPEGEVSGLLGRVSAGALFMAVPLVMWLGFADCVEIPKALAMAGLSAAALASVLVSPSARSRLAGHPLALPLLALSLSAVVSVLASASPKVAWAGEDGSWKGASELVAVWLGALAVGALAVPGRSRRWLWGAAATAGLLLAYGALQAFGVDPVPWDPAVKSYYWVMGTMGNPVHLGNLLVAAFLVSFALWPGRSVPAWVFRVLLLAGILLTKSRSALFALVGAGVVALAQRKLGTGGIVLLAAAPAAFPPLLDSLSRLFELDRLSGARPFLWQGALSLWSAHPALGVGPDMFYSWFPSVAPYDFYSVEPPVISGDSVSVRLPGSAHAEIVNVAVTQGVVGLSAYGWALFAAVRGGWKSPLLPAVAGLWLGHQANPASVATMFPFWALCAVMTARPAAAPRPARGWAIGAVSLALVLASLATLLGLATAQAHRREVGRLFFFGETAAAPSYLERWADFAAGWHPRQAYEDAMALKALGEASHKPAHLELSARLMAKAAAVNPRNVFYVSGEGEVALSPGWNARERRRLKGAEASFMRAMEVAPNIVSLHDDLARVYDAMGERKRAAAERALRKKLDVKGLFGPK